MDPILDEDFKKNKDDQKDETTSNIKLRVFLYFLIMLVVGIASYIFENQYFYTLLDSFKISVYYIFVNLGISLPLETIRLFFRKRKEHKTGVVSKQDPFWFKVIEGGFSIWILFFVSFVGVYLYKVYL